MILIIPMAGRGSRFSDKGFATPKPLIEVNGKPMLYYAYKSVSDIPCRKTIFIALKEHEEKFGVKEMILRHICNDFELLLLDAVTEGQLCTVLMAKAYFKKGEGLLVAASDSYVISDLGNDILNKKDNCAGIISVVNLPGENWSFAKTDETGNVIEVAEKKRISDYASTGLYYFSDAKSFEFEADKLIADEETTKGEYYIMPLYNRLIKKKGIINISKAREMWDMGTPEAKGTFEKYLIGQ